MELTPLRPGNRTLIQAYGNGGFKISEHSFLGSVIVLENSVIELSLASVDDVEPSHLGPLTDGGNDTDILLVGCGDEARQLGHEQRDHLRRAGIAVDLMNTGAACRTFNFLQAEGRRVAALLIAVD
ncbi:MAG: Mth938-like domain-containing protein [Alphaproteobacteria bacterium]|nr:Mth938-like domain-containing protein [Alphaproteobacteria bacterium]